LVQDSVGWSAVSEWRCISYVFFDLTRRW
jgi:hypothetical protein